MKKNYLVPSCEVVLLSQDAICASEMGAQWKDAWNSLGDDAFNV